MVLYVLQNDPASLQAWRMVVDYPEILVQDVMAIAPQQRPPWLQGVPTAVTLKDNQVYQGPQALQAIQTYVYTLKAMNGAQSDMVVPTVDAYRVADKSVHHLACADADGVDAIPLGTTVRTALSVGRMDYPTDDNDPRYDSTSKVSESELNAYIAMRQQKRQPQVKLQPSVLDNGEFVTM
jgi:hypothetical protein